MKNRRLPSNFSKSFFKLTAFLLAFISIQCSAIALAADNKPWRLQSLLGLPSGLSFWGEHRAHYESIDNQFRAGSVGSDQSLLLRTLLNAKWQASDRFKIHLEMIDSRVLLNDIGSRLSNNYINAAELLQGYIGWTEKNLFSEGSDSLLRMGRITLDIGSRRLIGRNGFRNAPQAYTGIDWKWTASDDTQVRAIFTLPITRQPSTATELLSDKAVFDEESFDEILWGAFLSTPYLGNGAMAELFFFGFNEDDSEDRQTRNRDIYTTGLRAYRKAQSGQFDFELETMFQLGTVRATALISDTRDLDHQAYFVHAEAGYTFPVMWRPRLLFEYDYASGDDDPNDGDSDGFDSLLGLNAGDWGPTNIYTAFVRSNLNSPGFRLKVRPAEKVTADFAYRAIWLDSATDAWQGASGVRDRTGGSGKFLGHQLFLTAKWNAFSNLNFAR